MSAELTLGLRRNMAAMEFKQNRETLRYKPHPIKTLANFEWEAKRIIGNRAGILNPRLDRRFVTFGSCFAENVAASLKTMGANVSSTFLVEDVNCPHNNRLLLRRVFTGEGSPFTSELADICGINYEHLKAQFSQATDVIFTLGNIYRLSNGRVRADSDMPLARETYEETLDNLKEIIRLLKRHTRANLFVSVSPVPISGYRGDEFASAFEADCASKSQLRAAIAALDGFTYIPTFEIFRWLGAHQDFPSFADGGYHPRHIDPLLINSVMEILCRR